MPFVLDNNSMFLFYCFIFMSCCSIYVNVIFGSSNKKIKIHYLDLWAIWPIREPHPGVVRHDVSAGLFHALRPKPVIIFTGRGEGHPGYRPREEPLRHSLRSAVPLLWPLMNLSLWQLKFEPVYAQNEILAAVWRHLLIIMSLWLRDWHTACVSMLAGCRLTAEVNCSYESLVTSKSRPNVLMVVICLLFTKTSIY